MKKKGENIGVKAAIRKVVEDRQGYPAETIECRWCGEDMIHASTEGHPFSDGVQIQSYYCRCGARDSRVFSARTYFHD